jgi:hypothetical protein
VATGPVARVRAWRWIGPAVAVVAALVAGVAVAGRDGGAGDGAEPVRSGEPAPVAVESDAPRFRSLDELVAASDVVVRGEVVATERGRPFGEPGEATIVSRLVTLRVDSVLAGSVASDAVLVEEEGWLEEGAPLVVDGVPPTAEGDAGVWFLAAGGDPDVPAYLVVGPQGRYLADGDGLRPAAADPLAAELAALGEEGLAAAVAAAG